MGSRLASSKLRLNGTRPDFSAARSASLPDTVNLP